jgi:Alpha/beta hydrolase
MTGLPPTPPRPSPVLPPELVVDAARAWLDASLACAAAGDETAGTLRRAGWSGAAAGAATTRSAAIRTEARAASDVGLAGVAATARFAQALRRVQALRTELLLRIDEEAATLARLTLEPDTRPDAPALRSAAWQRHRRLLEELDVLSAHGYEAEEALVAALALSPGRADHIDLLDSAHRALLALDDSPAATSTRRALRDGAGDTWLLDFDPAAFGGDGSVVVAYGKPSTADHIAVIVPGMTTDATAIRDVGAMALAVTGAAPVAVRRATSTIAWIGYDAPADSDLARGRLRPSDLPDIVSAAGERAATDGASHLVRFVDGLGAAADVTVIGHSYGSTTAAHAAADGLDADRLVLLGSPGAGSDVDGAPDLGLPTWVAAHDLDPVTWIGGAGPLGPDPADHDFGALRLPTDPVDPPHLDEPQRFVDIHAGYLVPGSASLDAVASVVIGETPTTVPGRTSSGAGLAAGWLAGQAAYELMSWR